MSDAPPVFPVGDADYDATYAEEAAMVDSAELIARALEASGITQAELARALRVSRSEITARLKGERNITVRKLAATLHILGATLVLDAGVRTAPAARAREWQFDNTPAIRPRRATAWVLESEPHG